METSKESVPLIPELPVEGHSPLAYEGAGAFIVSAEPDPNNPPWRIPAAILVWVASVVLLLIMSYLIVLPYALSKNPGANSEALRQFLLTDKTALLLQVVSIIPAHLLTLLMAWAVITRLGKLPFWSALGWTWSRRMGLWTSIGLAVLLLLFGMMLTYKFGGQPTDIDKIIASSTAARIGLAFLAVATAPIVEEVIYRGILYSALQRAIGKLWAIIGVQLLFTLVHVPQYQENLSVISVIGLLSLSLTLVRAYTGRLLPSFVIHLVFNGLQSLYIVFFPYIQGLSERGGQKNGLIMFAQRALENFL